MKINVLYIKILLALLFTGTGVLVQAQLHPVQTPLSKNNTSGSASGLAGSLFADTLDVYINIANGALSNDEIVKLYSSSPQLLKMQYSVTVATGNLLSDQKIASDNRIIYDFINPQKGLAYIRPGFTTLKYKVAIRRIKTVFIPPASLITVAVDKSYLSQKNLSLGFFNNPNMNTCVGYIKIPSNFGIADNYQCAYRQFNTDGCLFIKISDNNKILEFVISKQINDR